MRSFSDSQLVACIPHLRRYAVGLTRNRPDADDLLQDTLIRALHHAAKFDGNNLLGWLVTIMKRRHIDLQRTLARRGYTISIEVLHNVLDGAWVDQFVANSVLTDAVRQLSVPAPQLARLEFADLQRGLAAIRPDLGAIAVGVGLGFTPEQIGARLALEPGQVRSRVWRSRMWLRDFTHGQERSRRLWVPR